MTPELCAIASDWRQGRSYVHTYICEKIAASAVPDYKAVLSALEELGLEVVAQVANGVSVLNPQTGNRFTLKGAIYQRNWTYPALELGR